MLTSTQRNGLVTWFAAALGGRTVVWANQDMPVPAKPYGTLLVATPDNPGRFPGAGHDEVRLSSTAPGVQTYWAHRQHTISLQVYSDDTTGDTSAPYLLGAALERLNRQSDRAGLFLAGLSVQGASQVRDLTAMLPTRPESRAQADLVVTTVSKTTEDVGRIEHVELKSTVAPSAQTTEMIPAIEPVP